MAVDAGKIDHSQDDLAVKDEDDECGQRIEPEPLSPVCLGPQRVWYAVCVHGYGDSFVEEVERFDPEKLLLQLCDITVEVSDGLQTVVDVFTHRGAP